MNTTAKEIVGRYTDDIRSVVRTHLQRRSDLRQFATAETYGEVCRLMERFCLGELSCWTGHDGPRCPETVEIAPALAHANRAEFLTHGSQPGEFDPDSGYRQRAAVDGFATTEMLARIRRLFGSGPFDVIVGRSAGRWWERTDYSQVVVASMLGDQPVTSFGARLSRRDIEFMLAGIRDEIVDQIVPMNQVTVIDRRWGPHPDLWDRLVRL